MTDTNSTQTTDDQHSTNEYPADYVRLADETHRDGADHADNGIARSVTFHEQFDFDGENVDRETRVEMLDDGGIHLQQEMQGLRDTMTIGEHAAARLAAELNVDRPLHPSAVWGEQAVENTMTWGKQPAAALVLALAEELGEVADELLDGEPECGTDYHLRDVREIGTGIQRWLENHTEDSDGEPLPERERPEYSEPADAEAAKAEVVDVGALAIQLESVLADAAEGEEVQ